jgi:hypothetical protein
MTEIQKTLNDVPILAKDLHEIRQESFEHSQLEMAMENMNNIFNINKNIDRVKVLINDGNLLQAHLVRFFYSIVYFVFSIKNNIIIFFVETCRIRNISR